jgi:hypothetical protein
LEFWISVAAASNVALALANCLYFLRYSRQTRSPARRAGSLALALISGALTVEASVFLGRGQLVDWGQVAHSLSGLATRSLLLAATAVLSLLIWRSASRRWL